MELLNLFIYISIALPLLTMTVITQNRTRTVSLFLLFGVTSALLCGELNGVLIDLINPQMRFYTVNYSPIVEEAVKAIPLIVYAFVEKPSRQRLLELAIAVGIGFAILENAYAFSTNIEEISLPFALVRGLGAGLMHVVCTLAVGLGLSFVTEKREVLITGTVGLLGAAITFHSAYNNLIQSDYAMFAFVLPLIVFTAVTVFIKVKNKTTKSDMS